MSGCSSGQAGSQFCGSCSDYSCRSNPCYDNYQIKKDDDDPPCIINIYEGVEHLKGVKAPDIPIVKDIQEEIDRQVRELWNNFDN